MPVNTEIHPSFAAFSWIAKKAMNALLYCLPKQHAAEALCGPVDYGVPHTIHHCSLTTHYSPLTGCFSVQAALACRPHNFLLTTHYSPLTTHYSRSLALGLWRIGCLLTIHHSLLTTHCSPSSFSVQAASAYRPQGVKNRLPVIAPCGKALCLLKTQFAKKPKNPV